MDQPCTEPVPVTVADALAVQVIGDGFDSKFARAVALKVELVEQANDFRFARIDFEAALDLVAAPLGLSSAVSVGRARAVPESLPRVLLHGAERVLAVLLALVLIEKRENFPHQLTHRIVASLLGNGDNTDAVLLQAAKIEFKLKSIAEKSRIAVDYDHVKRVIRLRCGVHHLLEHGPLVIGRARPSLFELADDDPPFALAVGLRLPALVWDR